MELKPEDCCCFAKVIVVVMLMIDIEKKLNLKYFETN
jgi:hypothetical protein